MGWYGGGMGAGMWMFMGVFWVGRFGAQAASPSGLHPGEVIW